MKILFLISFVGFIASCNLDSKIDNQGTLDPLDSAKTSDLEHISDRSLTCLPYSTQRYRKWKESDSMHTYNSDPRNEFLLDEIYFYLLIHLDSVSPKRVIAHDDLYGPIEWEQLFENGIEYRFIRYPEIGTGGTLRTSCIDKTEFIKIIFPVIEYHSDCIECDNPVYLWKDDSTKYEPQEIVPGCYYEILQNDSLQLSLEWTCGC